jgi:ATP-dependent exoDNAse (exonuclease V) beta subunit
VSRIVFSPAAEALFQLEGPTAVSAGAGSGKTTALVELVVRLLDGRAMGAPVEPAQLAAITFTEKAAEELRIRVRAAVAQRAAAAPGGAGAEPEERRAWLERLHGLDRLAAGTIHSFCGRLLREHAPEAGLDPEFEVADEEQSASWLSAAARGAVIERLDAGSAEARALAAVAGAGGVAGWVAGLLRERATRGDRGPPLLAEADLAAVEAARGALLAAAERVAALRGPPAAAELAVAVRGALAALHPEDRAGPSSLEALGRLRGLEEAARAHDLRGGEPGAARRALLDAAKAFTPLAAEAAAGPQRAELAAMVVLAERRFTERKRQARAIDFDDHLLLARDLLAGSAPLRAELRAGLRALLVDEYQDVNPVQQSLFELLCRPEPGLPPGPVLVAVGDLKQSIYRFRGADVAVFQRLVRAFSEGGGRVLHLSENHRSAPAVLDLVNAVSAFALQPPTGQAPRDDEIAFRDEDRLLARRAEGARPACELLVDEQEGKAEERRVREGRVIAARIRQLVSGAAGVEVRERAEDGQPERPRRPRYGDVAVLFRKLTQLAPYERALREAGVPYRLARGGGFYQASEVRDLGELCAALADPEDGLAWAALLRSPLCAISDGALLVLSRVGLSRLHRLEPGALEAEARRVVVEAGAAVADPAGAEPLAPEERERLHRFLAVYRSLQALRDRLPLPELLARAVEALDLDAALLAGPEGERRAANLDKVALVAARLAGRGAGAAELAGHLRSMADRPPREPEADLEAVDAVALLTVHQAKGLEWPVVFIPDLGGRSMGDARPVVLDAAGRLCTALVDPRREEHVKTSSLERARQWNARAETAESRRLLYVALTRARDFLVLSGEGNASSWRGLMEAAAAGRRDLLREVGYEEVRGAGPGFGVDVGAAGDAGPEAPGGGERGEPLPAPRLAAAPPLPAVRLAVTALAEYARCPRRHLLGRVLGVDEPRPASAAPADDPARATARGTLAHAMLSEVDLAAPPLERRAQLAASATRRGYDPQSPGVKRIAVEVLAFLESPGGKRLAAAAREGRLQREVPFLLRLLAEEAGSARRRGEGEARAIGAEAGSARRRGEGEARAIGAEAGSARRRGEGEARAIGADSPTAVYLVGALDALVAGPRGELTVVDYKYATPRPDSADRYRLQLAAYALAASRAHPGARVRAVLQFLRGDLRSVELTPSPTELARLEQLAPRLAADAVTLREQSPADLGRDPARCRAEGCGYVGRCY